MKNNSIQLTVLFVLVLFLAQIFTPFVVAQAQSEDNDTAAMAGTLTLSENVSENATVKATGEESEKNKITFVLGTDENLASLENVSMNITVNATINVTIYNASEAKAVNFSNGSVVFLASLDNETVISINNTINESAYVFAYNLSSNISIGNVEDINITKYWVYGGDENIWNLVIYMDNKFYGNTTEVDPPIPPEDRTKITFVTTIQKYILLIESAAKDDPHISKYINVSTIFVDDSNRNTNVSDQNVIMMAHGRLTKERAEEARDNGAFIITHMFQDLDNLGNVNTSDPTYSNITTYWDNGGEENIKQLIIFLGVKFCNVSMEILPPAPPINFGIYHPDASKIFNTAAEYLEWYDSTGRYDPSNPTVGIIDGSIPAYGKSFVIKGLIKMIEERGVNVIFSTYSYKDQNSSNYFIQDNKSVVDAVIVLKAFRLHYGNEEKGIEYLMNLNVTPLAGMCSYCSSPEQWENSTGLIPSEISSKIALPELDGLTDFIFISGETKNPISGLKYYKPVDYQMDWIADRAISWAKLHRMNNSEKKIALIYYNHGGGKNNLGANYLDIVPSLKNLLGAMKDEGYEIEGEVPEEKELLGLMIHQGRNIGTWAPGELDNMVSNYSVVLIPENEYKSWFDELPVNKRQEAIETWGEPPGKIMVYENETGKYIVVPLVSFGNVILTPQPTRGWLQDEAVLYHDKGIPPHHQYLAFYFWLKKEFGADAILHLGKHGTQEWMPGKETALSVRECWPAILIQDLPVVYPYIVDDINEGTQAKRRGNAVIVSHLTPPTVAAGLYENLSLLHNKIHSYLSAQELLKIEYRGTITELYDNLTLSEDFDVSVEELRAMNDTEFEDFINGELHLYLHELADEFIPYGLHILGAPPVDWKLLSMVESMLGDDFVEHIAEVYPDAHVLNPAHKNCTVMEELLREVIFNGSSPENAQEKVLGSGNISSNLTEDLNTARMYAENLSKCTIEIPRILDGFSGKYIPPKIGADPIRNPDAIPTGNNFYSFDSRLIPTKEAWKVGKLVGDAFLSRYKEEHNGSYPTKVGFVLFAGGTMANHGITESEILYLLGVEPIWDKRNRPTKLKLISSSELGRPRIDVLITTSGLYRDTFPDKSILLDKAVRLAAQANDTEYQNYVKENSDRICDWLMANGYNETDARSLSMARVFRQAPGAYGTGLSNAIPASNTWENETKLADLYISRMGHVYGQDGWGVPNVDLFRQNLADVEVNLHHAPSSFRGLIDNDDAYAFIGGLALAVRSVSGKNPDVYMANLRDPDNPKIETLQHCLQRELRARYFNPKWIQGMMEHGYAGAREMDHKFVENLWGWDVVTPDLITEDMWNQVYDVYIQDKYDLGLNEFFDSNNPYAQQSITARMLETIRKGYWDPSEDVKTNLVETYQKSVDEYDVTCCHHTCGNVLLQDYMQGIVSASALEQSTEQSTYYSGGGGGSWSRRSTETETETETEPDKGAINATETTGVSKTGEELKKPPEVTSEKRGKVMKEEKPAEEASPAFPISGAPLMGIIAVIVALVLIGIGLGYKRRRR